MEPRKDYEDYLRFVNDTYSEEMLAFVKSQNKDGDDKSEKLSSSIPPLKTASNFGSRNASFSHSGVVNKGYATSKHGRTQSMVEGGQSKFGGTMTGFGVHRGNDLLDEKTREQFFNMSDGFRKIFPSDPADRKMVIPISGYGGHRRGDRSQNFFGKSFRETSLQSKKL